MSGQDIKLVPDDRGNFDLVVKDGRIDFVEGLQTSINVSLFTDARASSSKVQPSEKRRGWVGDITRALEGRQTGSGLWTLDQARLTADTISQAEIEAIDAVSHFVEDGVVKETNVQVLRSNRQVDIAVDFVNSNDIIERYNVLWRKTNASGISNI